MYFRRSLNKIVKVRPFVSSLRSCRYSHTGYGKQFSLFKYDERRNDRSPFFSSTVTRNIYGEIFKTDGKRNEKTVERSRSVDLMAPNMRSYHPKSTTQNRYGTGGKFHTISPKSLTLKMCRQPSKYLSTSQFKDTNAGQSIEQTEKKNERTVSTKSKAEICQTICGANSPISTLETSDSSSSPPPSPPNLLQRIIDTLTDAEIEEICRNRRPCPCKKCHVQERKESSNTVVPAKQTEKLDTPSTIVQPSEKLENTSTAAIQPEKDLSTTLQSAEKLQDSSTIELKSLETRNWTENRGDDLSSFVDKQTKSSKTTKNRKMRKNRSDYRNFKNNTPTMPVINNHQQLSQHRDIPRYVRQRLSLNVAPQSSRSDPKIAQKNLTIPSDRFRQMPAAGHLKSFYERMIRSRKLTHESSRYRSSHQPKVSQGFQRRNARIVNLTKSEPENVCHFEQLKPVPFRFLPIYNKNYHSEPVIENCATRFNARHFGVPYRTANPQWHKRQRIPKTSAVFGNKMRKNRQTFELQSNKWIPNPPVFTDKTDNAPYVTLPSIDPAQQSKKIMAKLVENLSVVIDGPAKLKLVTMPYPQLRNEKDVIIQMEYVNLTDADTRHFLTGKYSSYSYATTAVGRTGSGTIIETGQNVHNVKTGDKVFVKPVNCGKCSLCLSDRRNICENVTASETSKIQGILSRLHVHSSEFVMKIPDNVSVLNGAMTWTLSTAIRACKKAAVSAGDAVMVIGGGPLAQSTALAAQSMGATTVCLSDARKSVLDEAQKLGIERVFLIDPKSPSKNTAIKIWEQIGDYPRLTFDCRGSQFTNDLAINVTKTGGKVVIMTNSENGAPLPISEIVERDIDIIISTFGNDNSDIAALRYLSTKKTFFGNLMSKHYDLSNVEEAFQHLYGPNRLDSQIIVKCGCNCDSQVHLKQKDTDQEN